MNKTAIVLILGLVLVGVGTATWLTRGPHLTQPPEDPQPQETAQPTVLEPTAQQAQAAAERSPQGCIDCHRQGTSFSLTALAERVENHPPVVQDSQLGDCLPCHQGDNPWNFSPVLHPSHMLSERFWEDTQGYCTSCHQMEADGTITLRGI